MTLHLRSDRAARIGVIGIIIVAIIIMIVLAFSGIFGLHLREIAIEEAWSDTMARGNMGSETVNEASQERLRR